MTRQKNVNFAIGRPQKNVNLTIDLLSPGIYAPGPQVLADRPQVLRGVRICTPFPVPGPEWGVKKVHVFQDRKAITLRSGVVDQN